MSNRLSHMKLKVLFGWFALLAILLNGCSPAARGPIGPGALSPEIAAFQAVAGPVPPMPDFRTNPGTVRVAQKVPFNNNFIVVVPFQGVRNSNDASAGPQNCLFTYQVIRDRLGGWSTTSGGGSCTSPADRSVDQAPMVLSGGTTSGNGLGDAGFSTAEGQVIDNEIVEVRVTWSDNQMQKAPVVNGTFIAVPQASSICKMLRG